MNQRYLQLHLCLYVHLFLGQMGISQPQNKIGTHYYFTERLDATVQFQYMMHLGRHLHADIHEDGDVHFHTEKGAMNEGHLLFTVGLNYTLGKLWGRK